MNIRNNANMQNTNMYKKIKDLNLELLQYIEKNENLINEMEKMQKENIELKKKYKALSESKAGKTILKYWKIKRKLIRR